MLRVFPDLTRLSTWLFDIPWKGKLPKVIISYRRTPKLQMSEAGVKRPSVRLSGDIHRTGNIPGKHVNGELINSNYIIAGSVI